jgi:hypothetical protein
MQISDISSRYSPHGNGYIKMYRKLLTSSVFENPNLLKVWIWCLIRANWIETTTMFDGEETPLEIGQFITGRFTGSGECNMSPTTFYGNLKKLEQIGNIKLEADNRKTKITIVNYRDYQGEIVSEWQQTDNKPTTNRQPADTDKEVKNIRSKEYVRIKDRPLSAMDANEYFIEISGNIQDASAWFDYFQSNGWKVGGKAPMKDWKASARTWMRNKIKYGSNNGTRNSQSGNRPTAEAGKYDGVVKKSKD